MMNLQQVKEGIVGEALGSKEVSVTLQMTAKIQDDGNVQEDSLVLMDMVTKLAAEEGSSGATTVPAVGFWSSSHGEPPRQENVTLVKICPSIDSSASQDGSSSNHSATSPLPLARNVEATGGEISITVPSTIDVDQSLSDSEHESYVFKVIEKLLKVATRATAVPAVGFWVLEEPGAERKLMKEKVTIVSATCLINEQTKRVVKETAEWLCMTLKQEAVFVKIDSQAFLVRDIQREEGSPEGSPVPEKGKGGEEKGSEGKRKVRQRDLRRKKYFQLYKLTPLEQYQVHDCCHNEKDAAIRKRTHCY